MKKFKKISYILLIVIIIVLGFVIYSISASDTKQDVKEKTKSEIYYFESKFVYMLNSQKNHLKTHQVLVMVMIHQEEVQVKTLQVGKKALVKILAQDLVLIPIIVQKVKKKIK